MILTITDWAGDRVSLEPKVELYSVRDFMGKELPGLAIVLDKVGGTPDEAEEYAVLTVSFGDFLSLKNGAYIDTNNCYFADQLLRQGIAEDTEFSRHSGFCQVSPLAVQGGVPEGNRRGELSGIPAAL